MIRKWLTIFSILGLLLSLGLWAISYWSLIYVPSLTGPRILFYAGTVDVIWSGVSADALLAPAGIGAIHLEDVQCESGQNRLHAYSMTLHGALHGAGYINGRGIFTAAAIAFGPGMSLGRFDGSLTFWRPQLSVAGSLKQVVVPLWIPTLLSLLVFFGSYFRFRTRRTRKKLGLCLKCGYDLRGLPEPRCPECGTPFVLLSTIPS